MWPEAKIKAQMDADIKQAHELTGLEPDHCQILLRRYRWNVEEMFHQDVQKLMAEVKSVCSPIKGDSGTNCLVCHDAGVFLSLGCGHGLCQACWKGMLSVRISGNCGDVLSSLCPMKPVMGCDQLIADAVFEKVFSDDREQLKRFHRVQLEQYILCNPSLVYCPASACSTLLHVEQKGTMQVNCPECEAPFCVRCVSEFHGGSCAAHGPAQCDQVANWKQRVEDLRNDDSVRFKRFRMKRCPFCSTQVVKCACDPFLSECSDKDYCPNQACNHMVCENPACGKQYCWICLQPWEGHGSYFNCSRPRVGDAAKNSRFVFCYERSIQHANGYEAAVKRRADWLEAGEEAGVPKPNGHWICKAADLLEKYENTLMWSYVYCFYLAPKCWASFRRKQEPLEEYVEKLKGQIEEAAKGRWHRWLPPNSSIADQTKQATTMFAEISRLDEVLKDLRETVYDEDDVAHVNEIDALAETKEWQLDVDEAMDKPVTINAAFHYSCPICEIPNLNMRELFRHCIEKHAEDAQAVICPICADPDVNEGRANTNRVNGGMAKHMKSNHDYFS